MARRLGKKFFSGATTRVARDLLGCMLVRETADGIVSGMIVETEAYTERDEASHSFGGNRTKRNSAMFESAGHLYVYRIYGVHHCLNVVTGERGVGRAVLIRAVIPADGLDILMRNRGASDPRGLTDGPGKVCQAFSFDSRHDGACLTDADSSIYLLGRPPSFSLPPISRSSRVGISRGIEKQWRFFIRPDQS